MSELSIRSLTVAYGRRPVLENIRLDVEKGEIVGLIGANGSGKTTLLKSIAGLTPLTHGDILLQGEPATRMAARERAQRLSYLPQNGNIFWDISVEMLVSLGRLPHLKWRQAPSASDRDAVREAMRACDVLEFAARPVGELSGGERSRVLLARALASNPAILLADEPTSSLDPGHAIDVMKKLQSLAQSGMSLIVVMHDLTLAARYCDRLILLQGRKIAAEGTPDAVLTAETLAAGFGIRAFRQMTEEGPVIVPMDRV